MRLSSINQPVSAWSNDRYGNFRNFSDPRMALPGAVTCPACKSG